MTAPLMEGVIRQVTDGGQAPPWLEHSLERLARKIRAYVEAEESAPKRTDMRDRLEGFRAAVLHLQEDMSDPQFCTFIGNDWSDLPADFHSVTAALAALGNRAGDLSMKFSGRAGAKRAFPTEPNKAISSQVLCAWTVMHAMKLCLGLSTVAADNRKAWKAANDLYRYSGGMTFGKSASSGEDEQEPSGWRNYIIDVQHIEREGGRRTDELKFLAAMFQAAPA